MSTSQSVQELPEAMDNNGDNAVDIQVVAAIVNNRKEEGAVPQEDDTDHHHRNNNNSGSSDDPPEITIHDDTTTTAGGADTTTTALNYDPARMEITATETSWAKALKVAIEQDEELNPLNDFWLAQFSMVNRDDTETSIEQASCLQHFRQEYDIRDSLSDAKHTMWKFLNLFDNWILNFAYSEHFQSYVLVVDVEKIDCRGVLTTHQAWRTYMAGMYYLRQALNADLLSIGNGITILFESDGFDFLGKFGGPKHPRRLAGELFRNYPSLHHKLMHFHTSTFYHIMMTIVKPFVSEEMKEKFEFGCTSELGRLDRVYLAPTPHDAKVRNYQRIMETLQRRYHHEKTFRL